MEERASEATLILDHLVGGDYVAIRRVAALLRHLLIFDLSYRHTGSLAVAGIAIGDEQRLTDGIRIRPVR